MLKHVKTTQEFKNNIKEGNYLVDFYATWCGPCKMLEPIIEEISEEVNVLKVDIDELQDLATEYGIMSIPTIIYFENGQIKNKSIGYITKDEILNLTK